LVEQAGEPGHASHRRLGSSLTVPTPDGCAYVADYGAVRDFGRSDPDAVFKNPADAALVQIPGTGVIWKICPQ
jgi:hypothetical protein